jgi:hypothetical protein
MVHTRFFPDEPEAQAAFEAMKEALVAILTGIPNTDDPEVDEKARQVSDAISAFVARYP